MESVEEIRSFRYKLLDSTAIRADAVRNIFQIYQFDPIIVMIGRNKPYQYELPMSEWLREFVRVINLGVEGKFVSKLAFSGYDFEVCVMGDIVEIGMRRFNEYDRQDMIRLSRSDVNELVKSMVEFLISSYEKYGGKREDLEDVKYYTLR